MSIALPPKPRITLLTRLLHQHYAAEVDAAIRYAGFDDMRPGDIKVFPFVPEDGITTAELAKRAGMRKQSMGEAVERLCASGYVERRPNPHDRRSQLVFLTERGRSVQPVARTAGDRVERHWAELTSPEHVETLRTLLRELVATLDEQQER
ncbi:MarR family winged helix-turn-helix transcriptional regulator [Nocardia sp. NPDC020380]|uniref:MarR family winged helix-turn-helix transcriptional regulator n=1 Tax=Nocardia sp. NPDC020380 TaxID=3364309 RepID=UPI0037A02FCF